jgi:hypothetical protein
LPPRPHETKGTSMPTEPMSTPNVRGGFRFGILRR